MNVKVGITDDHSLVVKGLQEVLKGYPDVNVVWTAANASQTVACCKQTLPDVLLLDINLPDKNGVALCEELLSIYTDLRIIGLSSFDNIHIVKRMINKGASGYLLKNTEGDELYRALITVVNGDGYYQKEIKEQLVNDALGKAQKPGFGLKLTKREKQILELISNELTTKEIAAALFLSEKTIESHRQNLIHKVGAKNTAGLIKKAIHFGLI